MRTLRIAMLLPMIVGCRAEPSNSEKPTLESPQPQSASASAAPPKAAKRITETIVFPSEDRLPITADLHLTNDPSAPFIVLFHQAGWSRGEYPEIAARLGTLGFNSMAVDARSGGKVANIANRTAAAAREAGKGVTFLDALPDLRAALVFARHKVPKAKIIAWGSSYSAALVLYLASREPQLADATLAFAPGEYFAKFGKPSTWIRDAAATISTPVFITSAKGEAGKWKAIYDAIPSPTKAKFLPSGKGNHGSRALWAKFNDSEEYWSAVSAFLATLK